MAEGNVVCDCPDGHIKLGPYSDSVPQTPVSAKEPPKRKKAVRKKKEIDKKVPKLKLDLSKFKEIPPVTDDNGEYTEVQVLEAFNPDEILANIFNTPQSNTPHCPRCVVPMSYGCIKATDGSDWYKYYRCPTTWWTTKCYVTCGVDEVQDYLKRVDEQTHPCYRNIPPDRFMCHCNKSLVLTTSRSEKNPNRLYLKCQKRNCRFFQWIDEEPRGMAANILFAQY